MRCVNLTDDELWGAITQNTEAMAAIHLNCRAYESELNAFPFEDHEQGSAGISAIHY
jgi:hypothetical protein